MQKSTFELLADDNNNNNNNNSYYGNKNYVDDHASDADRPNGGGCACCEAAATPSGNQHVHPQDNIIGAIDETAADESGTDDDESLVDAADTEHVEIIERILRGADADETIRVAAVRCEAGSQPGDNYMSVVKRVHAFGEHRGGKGE